MQTDFQENVDATVPNPLSSAAPEETFLPSQLNVEVQVTRTEEAYDGYNLFVLTERFNILAANHYAVIMDMDGNIIHEKYIGSGMLAADVPAEMIDREMSSLAHLQAQLYGILMTIHFEV